MKCARMAACATRFLSRRFGRLFEEGGRPLPGRDHLMFLVPLAARGDIQRTL